MGLFDNVHNAAHASVDKNISQKFKEISELQDKIDSLRFQKEKLEKESEAQKECFTARKEKADKEIAKYLADQKRKIDQQLETELDIVDIGFSSTSFQFETVEEYKESLKRLRAGQKEYARGLLQNIREQENCNLNGSVAKGRKMLVNMQKMILRGFNAECDVLVSKVKIATSAALKDKIRWAADSYSKLNFMEGVKIVIPPAYVDLKLAEIDLALEYALFKEEEKENARKLREQQREEAKLKKEIEEKRKLLKKEKIQYSKELENVKAQIAQSGSTPELEEKVERLNANLREVDRATKDVDYREANKRAGYVYVISNIGAFGEGVYKIGMTRRLDPTERVRELGDASVPFLFDTHALVFSEDAPALESALHNEFDNRRVNMVNRRREFFRVPLNEIKDVIRKNYDGTVEFFDKPDADQYRMTLALAKNK